MSGVNVQKYKQLALAIAASVELGKTPSDLTHDLWTELSNFVSSSRNFGQKILGTDGYPEPRGKWLGPKGQFVQLEKTVELFAKVYGV